MSQALEIFDDDDSDDTLSDDELADEGLPPHEDPELAKIWRAISVLRKRDKTQAKKIQRLILWVVFVSGLGFATCYLLGASGILQKLFGGGP